MQRRRAGGAAEFAGASAPPTLQMAILAKLSQRIVVLGSEALHAQSAVQHRMGRARSALVRSLPFARATVVVTLLATEVGFEESFGALRVTLSRCQLPTTGTSYALIPPRAGTRFARQVAFRALPSIAVISLRARRPTLAALQLESVLARGAIQPGHARLARMQTRYADGPGGWLRHRVVTVVALVDASFSLKQQRGSAGDAMVVLGAGARLAGGVTRLAVIVLEVLGRVAAIAMLRGAQPFLRKAPTLVAAHASRHCASGTSRWAGHAFLSFLVGAVSHRAGRSTGAVQRKQSRPTGDALVLGGAVAGLAGRVTRGAVVILGLVGVQGTRRVTLVLVHDQVVLAARAFVRPVLTARAVRLARHASAVLRVFVISLRTLLQAHR